MSRSSSISSATWFELTGQAGNDRFEGSVRYSWLAVTAFLFTAVAVILPAMGEEPAGQPQTSTLQIALDRNGFGVGLIDGRTGPKTQAALADYEAAYGLSAEAAISALGRRAGSPPFKDYVITTQDIARVGTAPTDWIEASKSGRMACESLLEVLSEQFHSSEAFLVSLNPGISSWDADAAGKTIRVPNVSRPRALPVATRLVIDCSLFRLRAYDTNDQMVASFPCSIARDIAKTPTGDIHLTTFAANPTYVFDPANYPESPQARKVGRRLVIPAGPNCPVGDYWIGINAPGFGIHGTPHPETIGRRESHGCFRLTNWDIVRLARMVRPGTPVEVKGL